MANKKDETKNEKKSKQSKKKKIVRYIQLIGITIP